MFLKKIRKRIALGDDVKFITIAFIKIFVAKTLILWLSILLAADGRGTYVQFPIFYSWLALPAFLDLSHESIEWKIYSYSVPIAFFVVSSVLALILWFRPREKRRKGSSKRQNSGRKILYGVLTTHFAGVIACIATAEYYGAPLSTSIVIKLGGAAIALVVSYFFWKLFFNIADYRRKKD
ncbi:MAG: hypothetical protein EXR06_03145 [Rickettsiales bacterium]|nr:hypothetical protein [Rickettsiales bacterium]